MTRTAAASAIPACYGEVWLITCTNLGGSYSSWPCKFRQIMVVFNFSSIVVDNPNASDVQEAASGSVVE